MFDACVSLRRHGVRPPEAVGGRGHDSWLNGRAARPAELPRLGSEPMADTPIRSAAGARTATPVGGRPLSLVAAVASRLKAVASSRLPDAALTASRACWNRARASSSVGPIWEALSAMNVSKSDCRMRTRLGPTRTARNSPRSMMFRTVCWLSLSSSTTSATVM